MVRKKIFKGHFPVRSYMYTLRHFTRVKGRHSKKEIESFIGCVSGKGLSTREIELLAQGYFKGGEMLKAQIQHGNLDWTLRQLKNNVARADAGSPGLTEAESRLLRNLEIVYGIMHRLCTGLPATDLTSENFYMQSHKRTKLILDIMDDFKEALQAFYDKTTAETSRACAVSGRQA